MSAVRRRSRYDLSRAILDDHLLRDLLADDTPAGLVDLLGAYEPATTNPWLGAHAVDPDVEQSIVGEVGGVRSVGIALLVNGTAKTWRRPLPSRH